MADRIAVKTVPKSAGQKLTGGLQNLVWANVARSKTESGPDRVVTVVTLTFLTDGRTRSGNLTLASWKKNSNKGEVKARASTCEGDIHYQCERQFKGGSFGKVIFQYELILADRTFR